MKFYRLTQLIGLLIFQFLLPAIALAVSGKVIDSQNGKPIAGAIVYFDKQLAKTDDQGYFHMSGSGQQLLIRAPGYVRVTFRIEDLTNINQVIPLKPFHPKAVYLSIYGIGDKGLRDSALKLIEQTELNALVIDVKGDRGLIPYKSDIPLAEDVGAQRVRTLKDIRSLVDELHQKGIYLIARIVVFKDDPLATARPELSVKNRAGGLWRDRENLAWVDPFRQEVWDYNIDIAAEAAANGFDEIQFDYLRFPDSEGPVFSKVSNEQNRVGAIAGFLEKAKERLAPFNVFISADIFGYVCWNLNDTDIGQTLDAIAEHIDYLSPMLYPSGFHFGIPGFADPVAHPYEIIYLSLKRAHDRSAIPTVRFRPWLQGFRDYAFDKRSFTGAEIRSQISGAENFGSDGWMLWNPRNDYSSEGLKLRMKEGQGD